MYCLLGIKQLRTGSIGTFVLVLATAGVWNIFFPEEFWYYVLTQGKSRTKYDIYIPIIPTMAKYAGLFYFVKVANTAASLLYPTMRLNDDQLFFLFLVYVLEEFFQKIITYNKSIEYGWKRIITPLISFVTLYLLYQVRLDYRFKALIPVAGIHEAFFYKWIR